MPLLELPWSAQAADVDEASVSHPDPERDVVETASLKARFIANNAPGNSVVIGADTIVVLDKEKLGKPAGEDEARVMLEALRGRSHQVHTGISIIDRGSGKIVMDVSSVPVPMRYYSDDEIEAYIATGDPLDKAGAYAIQHSGLKPVVNLGGCFATVVGLPLCHLKRALIQLDITTSAEVPCSCQSHFNYDCPVFEQILNGQSDFGTF